MLNHSIMRPLWLLLLPGVQSLVFSPIASNASLSGVFPFNFNLSSNNVNISANNTQSPNDMEVQCRIAASRFHYAIDVDFCGYAISMACREILAMAETHEGQGSWNWVRLTPEMKCVAGFFVPFDTRPWMYPSLEECHTHIFEHILYVCGQDPVVDVGTLNIDELPNEYTSGTAIIEGYPRYLIAAMKL